MEYAIPVILVLIIVAAAITAFVMNSQRKSVRGGRDGVASDAGHGGGPGIGMDQTPLGDTAEHAGTQGRDGQTVQPPDSARHGGTGQPVSHYGASVPPEREREMLAAQATEGVDPGSAERDGVAPKGTSQGRDRGGPPDSERLADRPA